MELGDRRARAHRCRHRDRGRVRDRRAPPARHPRPARRQRCRAERAAPRALPPGNLDRRDRRARRTRPRGRRAGDSPPHVDRIIGKDVAPYIVRPMDLVPDLLLGVVAATIAALCRPARRAEYPCSPRSPVASPSGRVPRWLPITGAVRRGRWARPPRIGRDRRRAAANNGQRHRCGPAVAIVGGVSVLLGDVRDRTLLT